MSFLLKQVAGKVHRFKSDKRLKTKVMSDKSITKHCACSKSQLSDSPPASKPYDITSPPLSENKVKITLNINESSSSEVVIMQFDSVACAYQLYTVIGKGHKDTTTVHLAQHLPTGLQVAIKRIDLENLDQEFSYVQKEVVLTKQLQHETILPHYCSFVHRHELWTVMPVMGYGSCRDLLHAYFTAGLPELAVTYILRDVLHALEYLHSRGVIHRGVKASHVLISASGQVCLTGLHNSLSTIVGGQRLRTVYDYPQHAVDCLQWFSPEILAQNLAGYNTKSDIYSVGILACELANGQAPFIDMPITQMLLEKINGTKPMLADSTTVGQFIIDDNSVDEEGEDGRKRTPEEKAQNIFFQRTFSLHLHNMVSLCLEKDTSHRPTATQLLQQPCLKSLRRKTAEILPVLLEPVTPLTDFNKLPKDTETVEEISQQLSEVSMIEDWSF